MSTEEVSSVTANVDSPPLFIKITRQPPPHVFSDEWFDVGFDLSSSFPVEISPGCIELCANLLCGDEAVKQNKDVEIHLATQSDLVNLPDGQAIVKCRIKSPSIKEEGIPVTYNLKFFQRMRQTGAIIEQVEGVVSNKVQVVSYKLQLECNWGSNIFYKDEGGKDKHIPTIAKLVSADGNIVKGIHVPLKVALIYDNKEGSSVLQEDKILRLLETTKHYIDPDSGLSVIKFRIEDVSKNHQGLKFKLVVSPVGSRSINVGFAVTPGISVRSKRNKRTIFSSSSSPSRKKSNQQLLVSPDSMVRGGSVDESAIGSCSSSPSRELKNLKSPIRSQAIDLTTALTQVSEWAKEVSRILPTLNWTLIGYCQNVDGSIDYSKPNHLMPYPNDCIKRLTGSYSSNIISCLEVLQNGLDKGMIMNGRSSNVVGENEFNQYPKSVESNYRSPLLHSPIAESKMMYKDYSSSTSNIAPIPLNQMSPMAVMPSTPQNQAVHSNNGERKRSGSWNQNKVFNHDSSDYNDQLKRIDFIFAKHLLSLNGERLGFPVCDVNNDLIGFFRESDVGEPRFFPISSISGFDLDQKNEVNKVVAEARNQRSDAVHRLKDYGTLASLFDHVMVYDWSREFSQNT